MPVLKRDCWRLAMTPLSQPVAGSGKAERTAGVTISYVSLAGIVVTGALVMKLVAALDMLSEMLRGLVN